MYRYETIDLGTRRGDDYFLVGFVEPEPSDIHEFDPDRDAENYGISIVRSGTPPLENNVEVVRMDTTHGGPHLDVLAPGNDTTVTRKIWLDSNYSYVRMKYYLLTNWEYFVDRYAEV